MDEWDNAGANVITAAIAYVKGLDVGCDMVMVQSVIERLSTDPESIMNGNLTHYQRKAFSQYIASVASAKTAASIMFAAQGPASVYIKREITSVFCRPTNVPIVLRRKQMLIFRVDSAYKKSVLPIVSAVAEMVIDRNIKAGKVSNGLIFLDELPQYKILSLSDILATARSQGWGVVGAIQGYKILANTYGELLSESIRENFSTEITFPINSAATAKSKSDSVGEEDIESSSYNSGEKSSTTTQDSTRKLLPSHLLGQITPGTALIESQTIRIKEKGQTLIKVPIIHQFIIPKHEEKAIERAKKDWIKYRVGASARSVAVPFSENELKARDQLAIKLFPSPKKKESTNVPSKEQMNAYFSAKP
jgi:type IV secretory pathway TraG/TraD family ATPase VirD4